MDASWRKLSTTTHKVLRHRHCRERNNRGTLARPHRPRKAMDSKDLLSAIHWAAPVAITTLPAKERSGDVSGLPALGKRISGSLEFPPCSCVGAIFGDAQP